MVHDFSMLCSIFNKPRTGVNWDCCYCSSLLGKQLPCTCSLTWWWSFLGLWFWGTSIWLPWKWGKKQSSEIHGYHYRHGPVPVHPGSNKHQWFNARSDFSVRVGAMWFGAGGGICCFSVMVRSLSEYHTSRGRIGPDSTCLLLQGFKSLTVPLGTVS